MFIRLPERRHGWMAFSSGSSAFGTTRCSSKIIFCPKPWQTGQAPAGALKEKCFGVGGSKLLPVTGEHILFECNVSIQSVAAAFGLWALDSAGNWCNVNITPSPQRNAV